MVRVIKHFREPMCAVNRYAKVLSSHFRAGDPKGVNAR